MYAVFTKRVIVLIVMAALATGCGNSTVPSSMESPTATLAPSSTLAATATSLVVPTVEPEVAHSPAPSPLPPTVSLSRGPYLQSVTQDSILIVWETSEPATSLVEYCLTEKYESKVSSLVSTTTHVVQLTDLSPYTLYHYRVGTSEHELGGYGTFRTAASPEQTTFSFAVLGDTRTDEYNHRRVVESIIASKPDFYLHLGDLVEDGSSLEDWEVFFQIEEELLSDVPLFSSLGNHELNHHNYFDLFYLPNNERWYSFDYGHAHFVCLQIDGFGSYGPGSEQYLWLAQDLGNTQQAWKFVYFHVSPYSSGPHGSDLSVRVALHPLFARYGVDVLFSSHDHAYERSVVDGITYLVTGGGGAELYGRRNENEWSVYFESTWHFLSISIAGDTLTGSGVRPDGTEFDTFILTIPQ